MASIGLHGVEGESFIGDNRPSARQNKFNPVMSTEHKLSEIRQIAITVSDVGTALPFYRDVLGLTFLFSPAPTLAFLSAGGVGSLLPRPQGAGMGGRIPILSSKVPDIVGTTVAIFARGPREERAPKLTPR